MKKITLTCFKPFGGKKTNSSKEIVFALSDKYDKVLLPVSWDRCVIPLKEVLAKKPRYLFMVGEAASYNEPTIENRARNLADGIDEDGVKKSDEKIIDEGEKRLFTNFTLDLEGVFPVSEDAGKFLCNYSYYLALSKTQVTKLVFIHLPLVHSKGSRKKESLVNRLEEMISYFVDNDKSFLVLIEDKVVEINEENAKEIYPELQSKCEFPNIIIGIDRHDDGSFLMSGRMDGYKGFWHEQGENKDEEIVAMNKLYYQIAKYYDNLTIEDKEDENIIEKTQHFSGDEYFCLTGDEKKFLTAFICQADYTDELSFYKSLDVLYLQYEKMVENQSQLLDLQTSREYASRMGLEETKRVLLKLARK